ncbi:hypothetical protein [Streptomyces sp. NPDC002067]
MSAPKTNPERRLAEYGERAGSFNCGGEQALYRLACEMRDELGKARAELEESEARETRYANWLVDIRNAVGGSGFADLPSIVGALPAQHRAEVLREAAEAVARYTGNSIDANAQMLRRMADESGKDTCKGESTRAAEPGFFQPGHTYTDGTGYSAPEATTLFRVECVTRHPERGHLRAIGWSKTGAPGARWHGDFRDEGEFDGWTVTAGGGAV